MKSNVYFILIYLMCTLGACTNDKTETSSVENVTYEKDIKPLVKSKCAVSGCHVSGFQPGDFTCYETLKQKAADGKLRLMVFELNNMPPVNKLTADEKALFESWLDNHALKE